MASGNMHCNWCSCTAGALACSRAVCDDPCSVQKCRFDRSRPAESRCYCPDQTKPPTTAPPTIGDSCRRFDGDPKGCSMRKCPIAAHIDGLCQYDKRTRRQDKYKDKECDWIKTNNNKKMTFAKCKAAKEQQCSGYPECLARFGPVKERRGEEKGTCWLCREPTEKLKKTRSGKKTFYRLRGAAAAADGGADAAYAPLAPSADDAGAAPRRVPRTAPRHIGHAVPRADGCRDNKYADIDV
eukprot:gene17756-65500_t